MLEQPNILKHTWHMDPYMQIVTNGDTDRLSLAYHDKSR